MTYEIMKKSEFMPAPQTMTEAINFATLLSKTEICPPQFRNKPGDVLVAVQLGSEIGLSAMQALQNVSIINGRPCVWGDAALAVVQASPSYEYHKEWTENDSNGNLKEAHCIVKRKGQEEHHVIFSVENAKLAKLWGKAGPWTQYPQRMLQMRARAFAIRDQFADALRGIAVREEVEDIDKKNIDIKLIDSEATKPVPPLSLEEEKAKLDNYTKMLNSAETVEQLEDMFRTIKAEYKYEPEVLKSFIYICKLRKGELLGKPGEVRND